ncbi:acetylornithine aminotransferase [Elasticomyces elasticus]|uniref:acetylornithine transaminase n=1 Tax=Exophiala sideris TaxID=1016849 RepID=A0ABR0JAL6_9EURO|nr:acetylornithine aminotransferase [Elasticomyces elasticus]KAK5030414.1 acetylornithine aminotransferase [Exophiala sideris]KAK5038467.1 acetylornithine aminotransferase [Exophiala sideris]KAK5060350.1 acetylornithine aminotransferase [Exophiala sideris]KAK5183260.1 acetylornithine aminotransferase [Eurotiomycetes sp. CCFEE 6388]
MASTLCKKAAVRHLARLASTSSRTGQRCYASAAAVPTSSTIPVKDQIQISRDARLSNPDPSADSPTTTFLNQSAPFMVPTYVRPPPMMVSGEGSTLYDNENRQYLDFTAGIAVNSLGHADPEITRIIANQAQTLIHASNLYHNPWTPTLSKLLIEETKKQSPGSPLDQVFIANSGSEANEAAIKFARKVTFAKDNSTEQRDIVSFHGSFHGRTYGSLSATPNPKYQTPFGPMLPGFRYGTYNDVEGVKELVNENTAGVIVEPIQGEGGINVATPEFLKALRQRCDEVGAVLIFDEIQCGLSRTGDLWAYTASGVHPDILTTAKALGNGIPIGATLVSGESVAPFIKTGDHGTTFGGNPLACRVAHHVFGRLAKPQLQEEVRIKSTLFFSAYETLEEKFPGVISEVRGRGLIVGYQLSDEAKGKATEIITAARERGLLVITAGDGVVRIVPPLTISHEEINKGLVILEQAMDVVFNKPEDVKDTKGQQEMAGR